jgi:hypothetical protein
MIKPPAPNITLLQWLVVEGIEQCSLKLLFRQTRLSSPDSPPLQAMLVVMYKAKGI